jgi:carbon-monoxide dehydrogenase medium subunit
VDLHGADPSPAAFEQVARAAAARLEPHDDLHATGAYRRRLAATLGRRALVIAAARAAGREGES